MKQTTETTPGSLNLQSLMSERIRQVPRSFIREILKVAVSDDIISFAGGLPNERYFPAEGLQEATREVFASNASYALQYSNSEGYRPLREYISSYYLQRYNLAVDPDQVLITTGSQQALDLLGKVLIDPGDGLVIEAPGYLGAIQAFSLFGPCFFPVELQHDGIDVQSLDQVIRESRPKMMYTVPQFQNPSGVSYSGEKREAVASIAEQSGMLIIEDNPYTDLRFEGQSSNSFYHYLPGQTVMLGTFSKIVAPGFRLGWIVAPGALMDKLIVAKQAADLHSSSLNQAILHRFLSRTDLEEHLAIVREVYRKQCSAMVAAIERYFPREVSFTRPEGGMFLWCELPADMSSMRLFELALERKVAFVPGNPFYIGGEKHYRGFRMNFSCTDEQTIGEGIRRIADALRKM